MTMKVQRIKHPLCVAVALVVAGCEFIGPQIHTKLPLPPVKPALEEQAVKLEEVKADEDKRPTKIEVFDDEPSVITSRGVIGKPEGVAVLGKGEYSLNFDDADLGEVAKVILSDILGKNYTLAPEVSGKVTLQTTKPLSKEDLLPTLEMLLSINSAALVLQNGLYVIKPAAEALYSTGVKTVGTVNSMPSGYQVRIAPVKNVAANDIAEILTPLLPEKALLHVDSKRNLLLLAGSSADLNRALDLVSTFDISLMKGRSFAMFTPVHADAGAIIEELEQIFNNAPPSAKGAAGAGGAGAAPGAGAKKGAEGGAGGGAASGSQDHFYRFIEIDRLNGILAITHGPEFLKEVETWVLRLDKINNEAKGGVNVYRAQHHSAMDLANTLNSIFGNGQRQGSSQVAAGRNAASAGNNGAAAGGFGSSGGGFGSSGGGFGSSSGSGSSGFGSSGSSLSGGFGSSGSGNTSSFGGGLGGGSNFTNAFSSNSTNTMGGAGGGQSLMPNVRIIADQNTNALVIVANSQEYSIIQRVLKQLDVLPLQVLIDATIVEVTLNNDLKYGVEWYLTHNETSTGKNVAIGGSGNVSGSALTNLLSGASGAGTGGFTYLFANSTKSISAVLDAQATKNNINVISSPSLMVLNNQEATILVGDSVPVLSGTTTFTTGTATSNQVQNVDTGVSLAIRPRVNANGLVLMDLMQSVNAAVATTSSAIDSPTISKRQLQTSVAVQSGETIILGGLIQETNTYNRNGVPGLFDIPYIGPLFGGTTRDKDKTELVVLLTPRVMKSRQDARDVTEEFKRKLTGIYEDRAPRPDDINIQ